MNLSLDHAVVTALLGVMKAHIAVLDMDGNIVFVNKAWRVFGKDNGMPNSYNPIGSNYLRLCELATDECAEEAPSVVLGLKNIMEGTTSDFFLKYPCHAPAQLRWYQLRVTTFVVGEGQWILVTHEDISELELSRIYQSRFFHMLSHDLKAPLNVFQSYASIFLEEGTPEPEDIAEMVSIYGKATTYMLSVLNNMLCLSDLENKKAALTVAPCNFKRLVEEVANLMFPLLKGRKIDVDVPEIILTIDRSKIKQVLVNLVDNALKFAQDETIFISAVSKDGNLECHVQDKGPGIAQEDLERIFLKYEQTLEGSQNPTSSGLGLYICKNFVTLHNGKIWAHSQLGEGTTFVFQLPLKA